MPGCVWSTLQLTGPLAYATRSIFSISWGMAGQGFSRALSYPETSVRIAGHLAVDFEVRSVAWVVYGGTPADRRAVVDNAAWAWGFAQTTFDGAPLLARDLPDPNELPEPPDPDQDAEAAAFWSLYADADRVHGRINLDAPMRLFAEQTWALQVRFGADAPHIEHAPVCLKFILRGVMDPEPAEPR